MYRVSVNKVSSGSVASTSYVSTKTKVSFVLNGEAAQDYDVVIVGKVAY